MRATGARAEPDPVDQLDLETGAPSSGGLVRTGPGSAAPADTRAAQSLRPHSLLPVTLVSIVSALAVATYGVETGRKSVAMVGFAFTALVAAVMAVRARTAIRAEIRSREVCDRSLAKSERARAGLRLANERLQRRNADLQAFQFAVVQGFDVIDERTQGRLKELVEEAGEELAALVDVAIDEPTEDP
jgi:hypothetical protein